MRAEPFIFDNNQIASHEFTFQSAPAPAPAHVHHRRDMINGVIDEVTQWIDTHLDSNLRVDAIALRAGYSKWHLQRKFRDRTGISLTTYVRNKRLERATELLINTSLPLASVAEACGMNMLQFSRLFRALLGMTPNAIRVANISALGLIGPHPTVISETSTKSLTHVEECPG